MSNSLTLTRPAVWLDWQTRVAPTGATVVLADFLEINGVRAMAVVMGEAAARRPVVHLDTMPSGRRLFMVGVESVHTDLGAAWEQIMDDAAWLLSDTTNAAVAR